MRRAFCLCAAVLVLWAFALHRQGVTQQVQATAEGAAERWILIEIDLKRLTLYEGKAIVRRFPIASGAWETPSPIGVYRISGRFKTEMSGFGTRFLKMNVPYGLYGIHGTDKPDSIGGNASHGCFRLYVKDAETLYSLVADGTKIYIEGGPYGLLGEGLRLLRPGDRNSHVMEVQKRLKQKGYYAGEADGIYGEEMRRAVRNARRDAGLTDEEVVDQALYNRLGIVLFE